MQNLDDLQARKTSSSTPPASIALDAATKLDGRYLLKRLLARGGAAEVFAAEHLVTKRAVAIKIPIGGATSNKRLEREIEAFSRVRTAGIVDMLDAGFADGVPYIVFELLEGRTLAGLLAARAKLSVADTAKVGLEITAALAHSHSRGVVHRDVKPSNVFVRRDPHHQIVLLDFGIAQLAAESEPQEKLTREHSLLGTPEYMAPEALLSSPSTDTRVDVYGVGVTLYECLTGTVPFEGKYAEVLLKVSTGVPRRISELRSDVPASFEAVILRCLARNPDDRFQSMQELKDAIRAAAPAGTDAANLLAEIPPRAAGEHAPDTKADAPISLGAATGASRRRHPRAPYITLARLTLADASRVDGRLEEVSEGGLQFVGDRAVPAGETVQIRFALPASGRIAEVRAISRWNRTIRGTNATGFEFSVISEHARAEIRQYAGFVSADARSA
ncbi:MAG: protein kinase [Myxococcales bacterium]|nr:protein kinase [Myxococcales bacterium]